MGSTITIVLQSNNTIQVHYTSSATGVEDETRIYHNNILNKFNANNVLFHAGRVARLTQIAPPDVREFINQIQYVLVNIAHNYTIDYTAGITRTFVDEFAPRLARVGDTLRFDTTYTHTRDGTLLFRMTRTEAEIARRYYGKKELGIINVTTRNSDGGGVVDLAQLMDRIQNYVNNVRLQ